MIYHADWFHGDAFGVHTENIDKLIGFRCHTCRESTPPVCPQSVITRTDMSQLAEVQNNAAVERTEEISNAVPPLSEVCSSYVAINYSNVVEFTLNYI